MPLLGLKFVDDLVCSQAPSYCPTFEKNGVQEKTARITSMIDFFVFQISVPGGVQYSK